MEDNFICYFQRFISIKQLIVEVQARIRFKDGAIYGLAENVLEGRESKKN
jgi:hypothetical protein